MRYTFSRVRRSGRYPLATIAPYGPDNTLATKLVVAVVTRPGDDAQSAMRSWTTTTNDVRHDPIVAAEVAEFLQQHRVKDTITADRIIGCPHQEGIDYPLGRTCPQCPFWAGIDRFTHESIQPPAPTMSAATVLSELAAERSRQPFEALSAADAHRHDLAEPLLRALERGITDPSGASPADATLFAYALYLLAKWRDTRAYPLMLRWLSLPGEGAFEISGDVPTQDGGRILAAVCDGDLEPIKALVLNRDANEYCRGTALHALALLAAWGEVAREVIVDYFVWLAREGLERDPSQVWCSLANESANIEALPVFPELRRAYGDGLIDQYFIRPSDLDEVEAAPRGRELERLRDRQPPIDDVAAAIAWWADFSRESTAVTVQPHKAPPKIGRNERCPCGSGKKYKKCCGS